MVIAAFGAGTALLLTLLPSGTAAAEPAAAEPAVAQPAVLPADLAGVSAAEPGPTKPHVITPLNLLVVTVSGTTNMRACASTSCAVVGTAVPGNTLHSWCFVTSQVIDGIPWWDIVYNASTGRAGFITESLLNTTAQASTC